LSHELPIVWRLEHDDAVCNSPQDDTLDILTLQLKIVFVHSKARYMRNSTLSDSAASLIGRFLVPC